MTCLRCLCRRRRRARARCQESAPATGTRVSGQVEATEVQVAPEVGGRILEMPVAEGNRVKQGDVIARLDTRDVDLALQRAQAERAQADAQLRLLQAGLAAEDIRQAEAQAAAAAGDVAAAAADLASAETDLQRFEQLLQSNSGSQKQRDDAATRRDVARDRVVAAQGARDRRARGRRAPERGSATRGDRCRARAGRRRWTRRSRRSRSRRPMRPSCAPSDGIVTERLLDPGEMAAPRAPIVVLADLDHAWAEVFVDEPLMPRLKLGQAATVFTDAGGTGLPGTISFISSKAEFTPRNVQTAEDRSKLVYRVKIAVDNRDGVLKQGMPVEAEIPLNDCQRSCSSRSRHEEIRRGRGPARSVAVGRAGRDVRAHRPGRRRQDHDDPADVRAAEGRRRERAGARPRSGEGAPARSRNRSAICRSDSASTAT